MGLDFTTIHDMPGSAIYFIHDSTDRVRLEFERLMDEVSRRTKKQLVLLSSKEKNGADVVRFYNLHGTKFVLVVRDDDQLHHVWSDGERFDASQIAYTAEQAG